jgi:hypothetical protein
MMRGYRILVHDLNQAVEQRMWMRSTSLFLFHVV